jgi:L-rhamnose isomerase/sugar isomerase
VQTVCTVQELFLKAALVDLDSLDAAQARGDIVGAEECLKDAFATDVRSMLAAWRAEQGLSGDPLEACRASGYLERAAAARRPRKSSGGGSYA